MGDNKAFDEFGHKSSNRSNGAIYSYANWREHIVAKRYSRTDKIKKMTLSIGDLLGFTLLGNSFISGVNSIQGLLIFIVALAYSIVRLMILWQQYRKNDIQIKKDLLDLEKKIKNKSI